MAKSSKQRLTSLILGTALASVSPVMGGTSTSMGCGAGRCGAGMCGGKMQEEGKEKAKTSGEMKCGAGSCGAGMKDPAQLSGEESAPSQETKQPAEMKCGAGMK